MEMNDSFKAKLTNLIPILASLLFGTLCAFLLSTSSIEVHRITPMPEKNLWPYFNAIYFVVLAGVGATLVYLLLKRESHRLIKLITGFALAATIFLLSIIYSSAVFSRFPLPHIEITVMIISILITIAASFAVLRLQNRISTLITISLGGGLGTFLAASIPTSSAVLTLSFLAIYDTFAVYHGPVGKIASKGLDNLPGLSFSFRNVQMGLGDLVFYSMLSSHILLKFGIFQSLASIIGILIGCFLALKILEKKDMFPGLPLPIFFGLTAGLLLPILAQ